MTVLGIDCGLTTGWSIRLPSGEHLSGVWYLRGNTLDGAGVVLLNLRSQLLGLIQKERIGKVTVEKPGGLMRNGSATFWANALVGQVLAVCEDAGVPCETVNPAQVKRVATGKGNANKDAMVKAAEERWPNHPFEEADECDARWIAEVGFHGAIAKVRRPRLAPPAVPPKGGA